MVGAGAAGAVIAARLTERDDLDVMLVEAGPDYAADALPADLADGTRNSLVDHDWGFTHRPTRRTPLRFPFPRGRVVGGSSAVNTCIGLRGQPEDYDEWRDLGLDGWGWSDCLPAFKRLEHDLDFGDADWHGADGPLPLRRHPLEELVPWQAAFLEGCDEMGFVACDDTNEPGTTGYSRHAMNKLDGRRISAAEAWLTPAVRERANLSIRADTDVLRVVVDTGKVTGLEVQTAGQTEVLACKRVVLCGGVFGTPAILLRSGIGPRADLDRMHVDVVRDVPVGCQLLDHPGSALFFLARRPLVHSRKDPLIQTVLRAKLGDGPWLNDLQFQAGSCVPTKWGDIGGISLMVSIAKPHSVGRIHWKRPDRHPVIDSDFYADDRDRDLIERGLRLLLEMSQSAAMRDLARCVYPTGAVVRRPRLLRAWIPYATDSGYHPCGTVPMGRVTDARGRIDGVDGLRVADASLFPTVPSSNTHLPTLMLGERFGQWLREDLD